MLGSLIRNFKNAGVRASIAFCVQRTAGPYELEQVFTYSGSGLDLHKLASQGHRDILRQAMASALPRRPGTRFEDIAWPFAAALLMERSAHLRTASPDSYGLALPYACFIAEYLSLSYRNGEHRDVCINREGEVFVNSFAGLDAESKTLGNYRRV